MKKKSMLIVAILLMSIGFAAVSTTLVINGNVNISENEEDFSVIFTAATLDGTDVYENVIDDTKKVITFETNNLKTLNQTSVLNYMISNNSSNYDAEVSVTCVPKDGTTAKYTSIKNELANNATVVKAKESLNGTLTVTLNKTAIEEVSEEYTCKLEFNAVERDALGVTATWVPTYFAFGTPTTESTTDYTTLGKNVFSGLGEDGSKGVCIVDNGLFCIKANDYDNSVAALISHFGEDICGKDPASYVCGEDDGISPSCDASIYGDVSCRDYTYGEEKCDSNRDGTFECE